MDTRIKISIPQSLKRAAEDFAEKNGESLNQFIALALAEKIGIVSATEFFTERGKNGDLDWAVMFLEGRPE